VKVGSLIYDDYYGNGVIMSIDEEWSGVTIWFFGPQKFCYLDEQMFDSVEILNEGR
tara:strand:+ start:162 stop:329 length:168 start_codon:yes stop_codon:yes gene_type:complete